MSNVLKILHRDIMRILRVPAAWVIMTGLTVIPPLYAWFNIYGFWDPYGNTNNIRVAVANVDEGTDNAMLGQLNLGDQIESTLKKNDQLGWQFMSKAKAMEAVQSGDCYAAIIIPKDFSEDLAGVITGNSERPTLEYYVNEKASAFVPKVTDSGTTTVDRTVNSTFVSTVSEVLSKTVNSVSDTITTQTDNVTSEAVAELDKTQRNVEKIRTTISDLSANLANTPAQIQAARAALNDVQTAAASAGKGLSGTANLITDTQTRINTFSSTASASLDQGSALLSQLSTQTNTSVNTVTNGLAAANGYAGSAIGTMQKVNSDNAKVLDNLQKIDISNVSPELNKQYQQIISDLQSRNRQSANTLNDLNQLNTDTKNTVAGTTKLSNQFNTSAQSTLNSATDARNAINSSALPQLNSGLSSLAATAGTLSGTVTSQNFLTQQTSSVLDQLERVSADTRSMLKDTDEQLQTIENKLSQLSTDLNALSGASLLNDLIGEDGLDVTKIADFMQSPTVIKTKNIYPVNTYGSGMAPMFNTLSLWVGAFAYMVIMKLEVDDDDLEDLDLTTTEKYLGRFLLLAIPAAIQGALCAIGDLIIGVQAVNPFMFILTGTLTSLTFLSITYALSTTFMHVGKGMCILLAILLIPGGSGLYPIDMMPRFFRAVYPFIPFRYTIDAFRETIAGFYDGHWLKMVGVMLLFVAIAFFIGIVIRPLLTNLNRLFAREIEESDMIIGERPMVENRGYNVSQIIHVLSDKGGYREAIEYRASRFTELYPKLKRGALIAGFIVPTILATVFSLTNGTKLVALATWIIWVLLIIGFLMVIEYMRDSMRRQVELGSLSDEAIQSMLMERQKARIRRKKRALEERKAKLTRKAAKHHRTKNEKDNA